MLELSAHERGLLDASVALPPDAIHYRYTLGLEFAFSLAFAALCLGPPLLFLPLYLRAYLAAMLRADDLPLVLMLVIAAGFGLALLLRGLRQFLAWRRARSVRYGVWLLPQALLLHFGPGEIKRIPKTALERVSHRRGTAGSSSIPVDTIEIFWRDDAGQAQRIELSSSRLDSRGAPLLSEAFAAWAGERFEPAQAAVTK